MRTYRSLVGTAVVATLVATLTLDAAAKPKPKQRLSAVVNGHRIKTKNKQIEGAIAGSGGISITAGTPLRLGHVARSLAVTCASGPLAGGTLPGPGQTCTISYMETKVSVRHPSSKQWQAPYGGPTVTFTSFQDSHVQGTFEGTLDPVAGATGPATVTKGTFDIVVP